MPPNLRRYWFRFENAPNFSSFRLGCGVTAFDLEDARGLVIAATPALAIRECIEDVDISTLDSGHVIPNMGPVTERGIWFPLQ